VKVWTLVLILHICIAELRDRLFGVGFSRRNTTTRFARSKNLLAGLMDDAGKAFTNCGGSAGVAVRIAGLELTVALGATAARRALT
jgi:hypothetical protein